MKRIDMDPRQAQFQFRSTSGQPVGLAGRLLGFVGAVVIAILAFMFSLAALAILAVATAGIGGWLWWKTRAARKAMRESRPAGGYVIEGEAVRETDSLVSSRRLPE